MEDTDDDPPEPPLNERKSHVQGLDRILPELIRKGLEAGRDTLQRTEALRNAVSDSRFPRELAGYITAQLDDVRQGVAQAVAGEVRRFLRKSDLSQEIRKVLTSVSFEIKAQVRFVPNEDGSGVQPKAKAKARIDGAEDET
jgi:hypothetical protein